jgi:transposase
MTREEQGYPAKPKDICIQSRASTRKKKEPTLKQATPSPSYQQFVGVDIASRNFTAANLVPGTRPRCEPKPFEQTASGFEGLQQRLRAYGLEPESILIVMEASASYWISLATTLCQAGFAVSVINPAQAHHFAKVQLKRAKTNALDAQTLAELAQALIPERWTPPPSIYYELQQRLAQRSSLLELRTQVSNQLHALSVVPIVVPAVSRRFQQLIETITQQIAQLDAELLELVRIEPESGAQEPSEEEGQQTDRFEQKWKASIALLETIAGIGLLTAYWLVVATLNFSLCESAAAAVHYVGLAPMIRLSSTSIRGRAEIGHSGHTRART